MPGARRAGLHSTLLKFCTNVLIAVLRIEQKECSNRANCCGRHEARLTRDNRKFCGNRRSAFAGTNFAMDALLRGFAGAIGQVAI